ncbi:MAG: hypothetical protein GY906_17980 [bacterium]|nr:hypothetical protein [bacterium]
MTPPNGGDPPQDRNSPQDKRPRVAQEWLLDAITIAQSAHGMENPVKTWPNALLCLLDLRDARGALAAANQNRDDRHNALRSAVEEYADYLSRSGFRHFCTALMKVLEEHDAAGGELQRAADFVEKNYPLPRCEHGNAIQDHSGAQLFPSCGCNDAAIERRKFAFGKLRGGDDGGGDSNRECGQGRETSGESPSDSAAAAPALSKSQEKRLRIQRGENAPCLVLRKDGKLWKECWTDDGKPLLVTDDFREWVPVTDPRILRAWEKYVADSGKNQFNLRHVFDDTLLRYEETDCETCGGAYMKDIDRFADAGSEMSFTVCPDCDGGRVGRLVAEGPQDTAAESEGDE